MIECIGLFVNIAVLIFGSLVAILDKIYTDSQTWLIAGFAIAAAIMGPLKEWIDRCIAKKNRKKETEYQATINTLNNRIDELVAEVRSLNSEIQSLKNEIRSLKSDVHDDIQEFKTDIDDKIESSHAKLLSEIRDPDAWYIEYSDDILRKSDSE
jgi:predicted RNase H-like nuclease (RuvC/YqgF family)